MKNLHVGIILDGNRRFAKRLMKKPVQGHEYGAKKVEKLLEWCEELNIKELTLYCLSLENFNRPKKEFNYLLKIFKKEFSKLQKDKRVHDSKIKIRFIGKKILLDKKLQKIMRELEDQTKDYENYTVNFALAYGGRQEIIEAIKKMARNKEQITGENLKKNLWLKSEPDLIIRTGGEKRTSNFLPWQATYSEWIFLDKMWPEFTKEDLKTSIEEFSERKRRFGK